MIRKIVTSNPCPPIPYRGADWEAWYDGSEESGNVGRGATEAEAIFNLITDDIADRVDAAWQKHKDSRI